MSAVLSSQADAGMLPMAETDVIARAVLFDLDGTLIDSAPDLAGAANALRERRGLAALPLAELRPMTGAGARGMIGAALSLKPGDAGFDNARDEFLAEYESRMTRLTRVFEFVAPVLRLLDESQVPWGIVTNKAERYARPVVAAVGLSVGLSGAERVLVCGDTVGRAKPHPDPLFEAARRLAFEPARCLYVGDDVRDMQAGRAAGMTTVAAAWGYLGAGEPIGQWGADHVIEEPSALLNLLGLA